MQTFSHVASFQISRMHARFRDVNPLGHNFSFSALRFLQLWTAVSVWTLHYLTFLELQFASWCQATPFEGHTKSTGVKKNSSYLNPSDLSPQALSAWHCNLLPFQQFHFFCAHDFWGSILVSGGRYRRVRLV